MEKRLGVSAGSVSAFSFLLLAIFEVQGIKMPTPLFWGIVTVLVVGLVISLVALVKILIGLLRATEWRKRHIYRILGVPKTLALGEHQIPIVLHIGTTCYIGRGNVYLVKEKGAGTIVADNLGTVSFDTEEANYSPGIRGKGAVLSLVLKISAKSQWKGWLKIGFATEVSEIPYVHFPITFQ